MHTSVRQMRAAYLRRHRHCRLCGGRSALANHYPLRRSELIEAGARDVDADYRMRPLCQPCNRKEFPK